MSHSDRPIGAPFHDDEPAPDSDSGLMFNPFRMGSWSLTSMSDPRWDTFGVGLVGGLRMPEDATKALKAKKLILGTPPADLEYSYMKD